MRFHPRVNRIVGVFVRIPPFRALFRLAQTRPLTLALLGLSVALLGILSWTVHSYFRVDNRKIFIDLAGASILRADFRVAKGPSADEVRLDLKLNGANVAPEARTVSVIVPEDFAKADEFCQDATMRGPGNLRPGRSYSFDITGDRPSCTIIFQARVLTTVARELDLDIDIGSSPPAKYPIFVQFVDLEKLDVGALDPGPTLHTANTVQYSPLPTSPLEVSTISMQLRDRERGAQQDFAIFAVGILTGVVCSLIASIVYEFVQSLERGLTTKTVTLRGRHRPRA